jgi:hypothetical protein
VTVVGGTTPADHDGWMWDLTVPGNNDHHFYVLPAQQGSQHTYHVEAGNTPVLVHNAGGCGPLDHGYKWPRNNGFEGPSVTVNLPEGYQFDRYRGIPATDTGRFASPAGTAFEMRSLPSSSLSRPFTTYEVVRPFDVETGVVRPWGGQPGGGFQLNFSSSIADLLKQGFIRVVP